MRSLHIAHKSLLAALVVLIPASAWAQSAPTAISPDAAAIIKETHDDAAAIVRETHGVHNDVVYGNTQLGLKLDKLDASLQALLKQLQAAPIATSSTATPTSTAPTTTSTAAAPAADKYFPASAGDALFPSPENSRIVRLGTVISGKPYLLSSDGSVHQLVASTADKPNGYTVNGNRTGGGGSEEVYSQLLVRQGKVFAQRSTGQWQQYNPAMGSMYNAALPDAYATDASGATTSTVAASSVTAPSRPARAAIAPGSSGKVLKVCASGCPFTTLSAAIVASANGDTVDLGPGTWKEAPPAVTTSLKIVWEPGAVLDLTGLTDKLAHGKGAIVPMNDILLVNPVITGTAMDQGSAQGTAAIRPETGCNYIDVQGGELFKNQNGVAGGDVPVVLTMTGTKLHDNGLGEGYTHNIYMSHGTLAVTLINVTSTDPNGGHAAKVRAFDLTITGGTYEAFAAASIDVPDGSVSPVVIDGATIVKKSGAYNHTVLDYGTEDTTSGNGGLILRNVQLQLSCDNPVIMVGSGSVVTVEATTKFAGTKPTSVGGAVKGL